MARQKEFHVRKNFVVSNLGAQHVRNPAIGASAIHHRRKEWL